MGSTIRPQSPIFCISFNLFAMWICSLPLASLLACVAISILWHFDETTRTHCKVSRGFLDLHGDIGALFQNVSFLLEKKALLPYVGVRFRYFRRITKSLLKGDVLSSLVAHDNSQISHSLYTRY